MLSMSVHNIVYALVEQELVDKNGRDGEALYFNFDCRLSHTDYDNLAGMRFSESCGLHLLYYLPSGMRHVTVFSAVTENCFARIHKVTEWKHEVTHDSCWRDIEIFNKVLMAMADKINEQLGEENSVAPVKMMQYVNTATFGDGLFSWVPVEVKNDLKSDRDYDKFVVVKEGK